MSQNDPLLGSDWLDKESEQPSLGPINGLAMNGKPLTAKNTLNHQLSADPMVAASQRAFTANRFKTGDNSHQQLMSAIAMSSSDSSTDDIVIPMQKRRVKTRYPRKRRSRSTDSNLSMKSRALISCPSICLKVVLTLLIISSILFIIVFIGKLYDRIDSLQTAINDLSMSGNTVPQEMHSIHSHLKTLDTNVTAFGARLVQAVDRIDNLTLEVKQIKISLAKISESVEAAPAIRQLPKELQDLQKVVADMGSHMSTNDNEMKSIKDRISSEQLSSDSLDSELSAIHANITELFALVPNLSSLATKVDHNGQEVTRLSENLKNLQQMTTGLINWRAQAEHVMNTSLGMLHHIHDKMHSQEDLTHEDESHKARTEAEVKVEPEAKALPEPKAETNTEAEAEVKVKAEASAQPEAKAEVLTESSPAQRPNTSTQIAQNVSHNKKQSDDETTASPLISETSKPFHE